LAKGFTRGQADRTLFIRNQGTHKLIAQIYVDDIIFGVTLDSLAYEFYEEMKQEFEMSMIGELNYFLGLQVKQTFKGIFISQSKYAKDLVKRFGLDGKTHAQTSMSTSVKISSDLMGKSVDPSLYRSMIGSLLYLIWYSRETNLVVAGYSDADWAGSADDRKSTSGNRFYV
jgi:hypothetical protein